MRHLLILVLLTSLGCAGVGLPQGKLDDIARDVTSVGHPFATYQGAEAVGVGGFGGANRYIDVRVQYQAPTRREPDHMTVRFHVHGTDPCRVTTDVLEDSGPFPVLLDNGVASDVVGQAVCEALAR